ncbi:MAG TPA: DUF4185 domain-containing protein [bacterium]|nr:DUF4185 domain-containing protein [bacterium]
MVLLMPLLLSSCKITQITQPQSAELNSEITVRLTVQDGADANVHKGVLGLLLPSDWRVLEAVYSSTVGDGDLEYSTAWTDSLAACYPPAEFEGEMKWVGLLSDQGYAPAAAIQIDIEVRLQTGASPGCFKLGYLVTKATTNLLCSGNDGWAPFSYPNPIALPAGASCPGEYEVRRSEAWEQLVTRSSGWTGADGIYSIPLDGSEQPHGQDHLIIFSDTFIGQVDASGRRVNSTIVNNTLAHLQGSRPDPGRIAFMWDQSGASPRAVFTPATPTAVANDFYWLMDGVKIDSLIHLFALRLHTTGSGAFDWKLTGVVLLSFTLDENHYPAGVQQRDLPFFMKDGELTAVLGQAILPNSAASGNSRADGYIYIYGPRDDSSGKSLVAGRVRPEELLDFTAWRFWDGSGWNSDHTASASITNRISQEFSLSELNGRYILVCQIGSAVAVRFGDTPVGPFEMYREIYKAPEVEISDNVFIYNAKAHPSLSDADSLLITYNVNTLDFGENLRVADIYHPRFIKLATAGIGSGVAEPVPPPAAFALLQNYPNPFNPATEIAFEINERTEVTLRIHNARGQLVETLLESRSFAPGRYTTRWQPNNLGSGLFFYTLETYGRRETRKMMLIQ